MKNKRYDVAISFAEKDDAIAKQICLALELKSISYYYYKSEPAQTTGKNLKQALEHIYQYSSDYVIILISKNYLKANWTVVELNAALERAKKLNQSLIPIKIDKTAIGKVKGLDSGTGYFQWNGNAKEVADMVCNIMGKKVGKKQTSPKKERYLTQIKTNNSGTVGRDFIGQVIKTNHSN
jgi:hypothetical protein